MTDLHFSDTEESAALWAKQIGLDRRAALEIMGWTTGDPFADESPELGLLCPCYLEKGEFRTPAHLWHPSRNLDQAMQVVEKLRPQWQLVLNDTGNQWRVRFLVAHAPLIEDWARRPDEALTVWGESLPQAIIEAALLMDARIKAGTRMAPRASGPKS